MQVHGCGSVPTLFFSSRRRHTRWPRDWSSDVCSSDLTNPPSLTPVIRRLAEMGLLTRQRAANDERRLIISLTKKGTNLREDAQEIPYQMLCRVGLTPDEGEDLIALLSRIRTTLDTE